MNMARAPIALFTFITSIVAIWFGHTLIISNIIYLMTDSMEKIFITYFVFLIYLLILFILPTLQLLRDD